MTVSMTRTTTRPRTLLAGLAGVITLVVVTARGADRRPPSLVGANGASPNVRALASATEQALSADVARLQTFLDRP
jgi:hypothetical protein